MFTSYIRFIKMCILHLSISSSADTFTVCMESITAFIDSPLSFLVLYAFTVNTPYHYLVQLILYICQLFGDVLYFMTEYTHGPYLHPQ